MKRLSVNVDGREVVCDYDRYVVAKTKQLRQFGYDNLKESEVRAQLDILLAGGKWTDVVGGFIERDKPKPWPAETAAKKKRKKESK